MGQQESEDSISQDRTTTDSNEPKSRSFGQVFSRFADMTSMSGVGYIKNSKLRKAKAIWSFLLLASLVALTVHLWTSLTQFYSYPKTAKINLGFANLHFPEITICNINPVSKRRLDAYHSEHVEPLKRLVKALEPQSIAPEQFNDSLTYSDIADIYSADTSFDYYDHFWDYYGSNQFYDNYYYNYYYNNYYYDYYDYYFDNYYYYDGYYDYNYYYSSDYGGDYGSYADYGGRGDSGGSGDSGSSEESNDSGSSYESHDHLDNGNTGNSDYYYSENNSDNLPNGNEEHNGDTATGNDPDYGSGTGNEDDNGTTTAGQPFNYDSDTGSDETNNDNVNGQSYYYDSDTGSEGNKDNITSGLVDYDNDGTGSGDKTDYTDDGGDENYESGGDGMNTDTGEGSGETPPVKMRRKKRYAEMFDHFNFTEFDPTFDHWFKHNKHSMLTKDEFKGKVDTSTKIDALFRKTFMNLARWERGRLGHNITKMLLKCTFAGRTCDEKKLFRLHQTPEYGNCWTLASRKFIAQDAGPNAGLSLVLNLQSTDYLAGITQGYGARIQIHNRGAYPDPFQDGISIPASMETSIGLKLVTFKRLSGNYGDCEDGEDFGRLYKRPYTRRTCQIFCHAERIIKTCGCYDEHTEEVAVNTGIGTGLKACNTVEQYDCVHRVVDAFERKEITCSCRNPCKESAFTKSISSHQWPSDGHAKLLLAGICADDAEACKAFLNTNNTISTVFNNFLKLNIYFEDLNYEEIVEEPDIGIAQILSDVGGAVGLWIGLSVMSFCEVLQLFMEVFQLLRHKIRKSQRLKRQKSARKRKAVDNDSSSVSNGQDFGTYFNNKNDENNGNVSSDIQNGSRIDSGNVFSFSNNLNPYGPSPFGPVRGFDNFPAFGPSRLDRSLTGYSPVSKRSRY